MGGSSLSNWHTLSDEAEDLGHKQLKSPASDTLI